MPNFAGLGSIATFIWTMVEVEKAAVRRLASAAPVDN
jgi:hypothetical protein